MNSHQSSNVAFPNYTQFLELCRCPKCSRICTFAINPLTFEVTLSCLQCRENVKSRSSSSFSLYEEGIKTKKKKLKEFFNMPEMEQKVSNTSVGSNANNSVISSSSSELNQNLNKNKGIYCSECSHESFSNLDLLFCKDCRKVFCLKCKGKHFNSNHFSIIPYYSLENLCQTHHRDYTAFCIECQKNICTFCKKEHEKHRKIELGDLIPSQREFENIKEELGKEKEKVKRAIEELKTFKGKVGKTVDDIAQNLETGFKIKSSILTSFNYDNCLQYEKIMNYLKIKDINLISNELNKFILGYDIIEKGENFFNFLGSLAKHSEDENKRKKRESIKINYINELNSKIFDLKSKNKEYEECNFNSNLNINNKYLISQNEFEDQIFWIQPLDSEHLIVCSAWMELYEIKTDCCINPNFNKISHIEQGANHVCILKNGDVVVSYDKLRFYKYDKSNCSLTEKYCLEIPQDSCSINKSIELSNGYIASCDFKRIYIWKPNSKGDSYIQHKEIFLDTVVRCLFQIDENTFVSTQNGEKTVRFFDVNTLEEVKIIHNIKSNGGPNVINFMGKEFFGIGLGIGINLFSIKYREKVKFIETGECVTYINPYSDFILCAVRTKNKEFSLVEYKLDEYADLIEISRKKTVHKDVTWCIQFLNNGIVASSSYDKTVKLWK